MIGDVLFGLLILALVVFFLAALGNQRNWARRPKRLCMNCFSVRQPLRKKNREWYCPACQRDNPVPLDSPAAQAHFKAGIATL